MQPQTAHSQLAPMDFGSSHPADLGLFEDERQSLFDASATMLMELANSGVRFCGLSILAYGSHALLS
jgi:hypothetical protein